MKEKLIADLISELYSKLDKNPAYAVSILKRMFEAGIDPDLVLDSTDDIVSDAKEYATPIDPDRCLECGTTLGRGTCEACRQDRKDRQETQAR
jgi:hypothetical protein